MKLAYPLELTLQDDASYLVSFPDIPEALTDGETKKEALSEAVDCLIAALGGYINDRREIPIPSRPKQGQPMLIIPLCRPRNWRFTRQYVNPGSPASHWENASASVRARSAGCLILIIVPISARWTPLSH